MIKIGTSGFSFKDWRGTVYPGKLDLKDALSYYQGELGFHCVEINSTYYTLISARSFEGMRNKVRPDFEFVVKGYRGITHDPFDPRLKREKPSLRQAREDMKKFIYSLGPLCENDELGAVLLQFPVFFYPSHASKDYLAECRETFKGIPLVVEFRTKAWNHPDLFAFLKKNDLAYCAVDEPKIPRLMPFINEVTSDIAYLRFHGRNKNWFHTPISGRHKYLYSEEELREFVPEIKRMDRQADTIYVFFNNSYAGFAVKNALTLKHLLHIPAPEPARELVPA